MRDAKQQPIPSTMNIKPMRLTKIVLFAFCLFSQGIVNAVTGVQTPTTQGTASQWPPAGQPHDEASYMEQAADHFNSFFRQIPGVIAAKLNAFRKSGFRAVLLDDPVTQPAEEAMIDSLMKALQAWGNALLEDLSPPPSPAQRQKK